MVCPNSSSQRLWHNCATYFIPPKRRGFATRTSFRLEGGVRNKVMRSEAMHVVILMTSPSHPCVLFSICVTFMSIPMFPQTFVYNMLCNVLLLCTLNLLVNPILDRYKKVVAGTLSRDRYRGLRWPSPLNLPYHW